MAEILRVRHKQVHVLAAPMAMAQHQHSAAAEGPDRIAYVMCADIVDEAHGVAEKPLPRARQDVQMRHTPHAGRGDLKSRAHR